MPPAQNNSPGYPQDLADPSSPTARVPQTPSALVNLATRMRESAVVSSGLGAEQRAALIRLGDAEAIQRFGEIDGRTSRARASRLSSAAPFLLRLHLSMPLHVR